MSCKDTSNINETIILEPIGDDFVTITACTGVYTNYIYSCSGNSEIQMSDEIIVFTKPISINGDIYACSGTVFTSNISGCSPVTINDVLKITDTGVTLYDNYTMPIADGTYFQAIVTDGVGNLYFSNIVDSGLTVAFTSHTADTTVHHTLDELDERYINNSGGTIVGDLNVIGSVSGTSLFSGDTNLLDIFSTHDYYVTGGTNSGYLVTLTRNDGVDVSFSLASFVVQLSGDTFTTGGTFNNNILSFLTSGGIAYSIPIVDFSSVTASQYVSANTISANTFYGDGSNLTGINDYYTTGITLTGKNLCFDRNDVMSAYSISLSGFAYQSDLTSHTGDTTIHYALSSITLSNIGDSAHTHPFSSITSTPTTLDGYGITDAVNSSLFDIYTGTVVPNTYETIVNFTAHTANTAVHHTISELDGYYVNITGDTITGPIVISNTLNVSGDTTLNNLYLSGTIKSYSGITSGLDGKFLSGTTNGFVLANVSDIIGSFDNFTFSGDSVGSTVQTIDNGENLLFSGGTGINAISTANRIISIKLNDTAVSAGTYGSASVIPQIAIDAQGRITTATPLTINIVASQISDFSTSAKTVIFQSENFVDSTTVNFTVGAASAATADVLKVPNQLLNGLGITGLTFDGSSAAVVGIDNSVVVTLTDIQTLSNKTFSGVTLNAPINTNLTGNRLVYTTAGGALTADTALFDGVDMTLPVAGSLSVGTGGLTVGTGGGGTGHTGTGDLIVHGSLIVFGPSISAYTSELYVEDNNIYLNYNPTGSTAPASIGAGWSIQDGSGISGSPVNININRMDTFTGLTPTEIPDISEYTSAIGYANRSFVTQLNDIVLRSTNISTPNGVRVICEWDELDGGIY